MPPIHMSQSFGGGNREYTRVMMPLVSAQHTHARETPKIVEKRRQKAVNDQNQMSSSLQGKNPHRKGSSTGVARIRVRYEPCDLYFGVRKRAQYTK